MNKNRQKRSILEVDTNEIEKIGKQIMEKPNVSTIDKNELKSKKKGKKKIVYLDESTHKEARIKASIEGITIKQFVTNAIINYTP